MVSPIDGILLASARSRLQVAAIAVLCLWGAVLWASLSVPSPPAADRPAPAPAPSTLRRVVAAGQPAPTGGSFSRFDVSAQPIVAPVNKRGQVAFYAGIVRAKATEGIFLATGPRLAKVAAVGDPVPGGGTLSEFAKHPIPALNDAGKVAFGAAVAGARATEGIFLADGSSLKAIALSGADAPGVPRGTLAEFDTPALNNRDEVAFVATVRRGRETLQLLFLYSNGNLRKLVGEGDPAPRGGTFDKFGVPALNNKGVVAFPATVEHGAVLGGIFVAGSRDLRLLAGAGETEPNGGMLVRFSERVAVNDDDEIALGAHLALGTTSSEAVFLADPAGLTQVAALGEAAPGGGKFSAFGPWPTLGPTGAVGFVAAIDDGPGPIGVFLRRAGELQRIAMTGDRSADGGALGAFAINPVVTAGPNGAVTFATVGEPESGKTAIYYYGPPPTTD